MNEIVERFFVTLQVSMHNDGTFPFFILFLVFSWVYFVFSFIKFKKSIKAQTTAFKHKFHLVFSLFLVFVSLSLFILCCYLIWCAWMSV